MSSRREKLLEKIDPKLLEITPKLSSSSSSIIHLDLNGETLKPGAKELMLRFYKQKLSFKSTLNDDSIEISDRESYEFCKSISERLSLPFSNENRFKLERPGKKYQDLKKKLEEEMSIKRKEEYDKRITEYNKWKSEQKKAEEEDEEEEDEEQEDKEEEDEEQEDKEEEEEDMEEKKKNEEIEENKKQTEEKNTVLNDGTFDDKSKEIDDENLEVEEDFCKIINGIDCDNNSSRQSYDSTCNVVDSHYNACISEKILNESVQESEIDIAKNINDNVEDNNDIDNNADRCSFIPPYQSGGEVLPMISQQTEYSQDLPINLLPSSLTFSFSESQTSKISHDTLSQDFMKEEKNSNFFSERYKLFSNSQNPSNSFDLTEAYELCSGKFPGEDDSCPKPEQNLEEEGHNLDSWIDEDSLTNDEMKKNNDDDDSDDVDGDDDDDDDDDGGDDDNDDDKSIKHRQSIKPKKRIVIFEDSDNEEVNKELEENKKDEPKFSTIVSDDEINSNESFKSKKKKVKQVLNFSDDEEESCDESDESNGKDCDQRSVHYDSEENEIIHPKDFIEGEAELSGSELSGDEDERDLDIFDKEAGDEDILDKNKVLSELKQIHLRWSLDEDMDKIRRLQEIYLEDGDLHTDTNEKKFRWKNLAKFEEEQTTIIDDDAKDETGDSSGDEYSEDLEVRKERLAKLLQFEQMKEKGESFLSYDLFKKICRASKQTTIEDGLKASINNRDKTNHSTTIAAAAIANSCVVNNCRGSFLRRDEDVLLRLAKVTASANDNVRGPQNSKNFVFATKSPEKTEPANQTSKRPTEEPEKQPCKKKLKLGVILPDSIPSILDLWDK